MVNKAQLDHLQTALKDDIILHITRIKLQREGKRAFYIAIGQPLSNPSVQAKINPRVLPNRRGNGLNEAQLRLLARHDQIIYHRFLSILKEIRIVKT